MPLRHCWYSGINLAPAEFKQGDVVTQREIPMAKHILMLTTVAFALVRGGIPARAQEDSDDPQSRDIGRKCNRTRATKKTPAGWATAVPSPHARLPRLLIVLDRLFLLDNHRTLLGGSGRHLANLG
jgi:hypothetical protein